MVFTLLGSLAGFIKVRYLVDKATIDNTIFRLHYRFTAAVLFVFCLLCTANSFIGNPIECLVDDDKKQKVINTYCWIQSTFTVPAKYREAIEGVHVAHPGVGPHVEGEDIHRHAYYQWVPFMLFFQGLMFYAPHWFWKNWEDGKIRHISDGIRGPMAETREERRDRQSRIVRYLIDSMQLHNTYAIGYFFCEALNFVNVVGNIYLTNTFLGGKFLSYGLSTIRQTNSSIIDPRYELFPRVTKCTFRSFGSSGSIQLTDHMCVLALNIINEKVYIFLWWWFIILSILSGMSLIYSIAIIGSPAVRRGILFRRFKFRISDGVRTIVQRMQVGDFLVLHLLGQNVNMAVFTEMLEELAHKLNGYAANAPPPIQTNPERIPMYPTKDSFLPH